MWTKQHRETHKRLGRRYPSDLTDNEWTRLAPLIPPAKPGGRPRTTKMGEAMNAILYLLRTGCPWRYLPRDGFPPRSTVYNIFRNFQRAGVWDRIWEHLHGELREHMAHEASPTASIIDSQSLKSAEKGAVMSRVGYVTGKKIKGRKIHALVATDGLPMRVIVHSAGIQDRDGAAFVLEKIRARFPWLELVWADGWL